MREGLKKQNTTALFIGRDKTSNDKNRYNVSDKLERHKYYNSKLCVVGNSTGGKHYDGNNVCK